MFVLGKHLRMWGVRVFFNYHKHHVTIIYSVEQFFASKLNKTNARIDDVPSLSPQPILGAQGKEVDGGS